MKEDKKSALNDFLPDAVLTGEVLTAEALPAVLQRKTGRRQQAALEAPNVGHRQRMKKRFLKDPAAMDDYEVLELVLGYAQPRRDTRLLAKELLHRFSTMEGVLGATPEALLCAPGMGAGLTLFCRLLRECQVRCAQSGGRVYIRLRTAKERMDFVKMRVSSCAHEEVWLGTLDKNYRLIDWERLNKGSVNSAELSLRELIKKILERQAVHFFLVHNHPGGTLAPSPRDLDTTLKVRKIAHELEIFFDDHIIVTADACYSFVNEERMPPV